MAGVILTYSPFTSSYLLPPHVSRLLTALRRKVGGRSKRQGMGRFDDLTLYRVADIRRFPSGLAISRSITLCWTIAPQGKRRAYNRASLFGIDTYIARAKYLGWWWFFFCHFTPQIHNTCQSVGNWSQVGRPQAACTMHKNVCKYFITTKLQFSAYIS